MRLVIQLREFRQCSNIVRLLYLRFRQRLGLLRNSWLPPRWLRRCRIALRKARSTHRRQQAREKPRLKFHCENLGDCERMYDIAVAAKFASGE